MICPQSEDSHRFSGAGQSSSSCAHGVTAGALNCRYDSRVHCIVHMRNTRFPAVAAFFTTSMLGGNSASTVKCGVRRASGIGMALLAAGILSGLSPDALVAGEIAGPSAAARDGAIAVSVPYATNRRREHSGASSYEYGSERGSPAFGQCEVTFEPIPIINELAAKVPFYVPAETTELRVTSQRDETGFLEALSDAVTRTSSGSVVVFVHGYNYGFDRTCRVAAELQRALLDEAVVLMFSWPSNGRPSDYLPDQADVEWSVPFLAHILRRLGDRLGRENVQVLAHSLGTRGVVFALADLSRHGNERRVTGPLVLMAPDFDAQAFVERLPDLVPLTSGITLYASSNDTPLKVSQQLHDAPRLGQAGEFLTVADGMQTVDVSALGRYQVLGHEYFLFHPRVAADLKILLGEGRDARARPWLEPATRDGLIYWTLGAEGVDR